MRVIVGLVSVILATLVIAQVEGLRGNIVPGTPQTVDIKSTFLENADNTENLLDLMKNHFDLSLKYLYTGKQYGSQYVERPGMAKVLGKASDKQWEAGLDLLNKYLQRGGRVDGNFKEHLKVSGKGELNINNAVTNDMYVTTLRNQVNDAKGLFNEMTRLHHKANKNVDHHGDAEIGHYFDEKMEKLAERIRELAGHVVTLDKMKSLGVAVNMFDSNL